MSIQYRSSTTERWLADSRIKAVTSAGRSSPFRACWAAPCPRGMPGPDWCALRLRNLSRLALSMTRHT
jgi:hypothetical protein